MTYVVPYLDNIKTIPMPQTNQYPQSDIFPGMIKIQTTHPSPPETSYEAHQGSTHRSKKPVDFNKFILPIGGLVVLACLTMSTNQNSQKIENFPSMLAGSGICLAAILTGISYGTLKYGGFFKPDRDFPKLLNNA
ncbi:MAG: hypothetical protein ACJARD_000201 [Alphaproteobacteria bacterium]|jgi:hypothetical protein